MMILLSGVPAIEIEQQRSSNLEKLYYIAEQVLARGYTPAISLQTAARLASNFKGEKQTKKIFDLSQAIAFKSDAILILQDTPEINMEKVAVQRKGGQVYTKIKDIPTAGMKILY